MNKKVVAHFLRKNTQLKASFIQNQILNHIKYNPSIIYRYQSANNDGGFAEFNNKDIPLLNLSLFKMFDINYRYLKKINKYDVKNTLNFLNEYNVDILHFHYGSDACIFTDVIKLSNRPSVVSFYGYDSSSFKDFLFSYGGYLLRSRLFPYVSKVLAMSPDMKNDLLKCGCPEDKIIVHYYGSDVKKFYQPILPKKNKETVFLIISGLEPQKGHLFLLKAFKKAAALNKNIRLKIFGAGSIENKIKGFIIKNDLSSCVSMNGRLIFGSKEHLKELKNADVFIHPSVTAKNGDKEGIPGAIVEAMASGLPVISTYHAGIPYIIENNKTGLLVNEWDISELSNKIEYLAVHSETREQIGEAGQRYALNNLDLNEKEIELENIYDELINEN